MEDMVIRILVVILCLALPSPGRVAAHEFWIEPTTHVLDVGATVEANLKVGQDYSGSVFPFLPRRFEAFLLSNQAGVSDVQGIVGDIPAVKISGLPRGLQIITYSSTADTLKFSDWELFNTYVAYEGNDWAVAAHQEAGLPLVGFTEAYTRHAKALVQVGAAGAEDADRAVGMALELVALNSPYRLGPGQTELPVQLLWQGAPLPDQQINIFHKADTVTLSSVATDKDGVARIPLASEGRYLLNAVHMELTGPDADHEWRSFWASLTFAVGPHE